jgi:hypothetical protein
MPPKGKKKAYKPLSQPVLPDWVDEPGIEMLGQSQIDFLLENPESAQGVLKLLQEKGNLPPLSSGTPHDDLDDDFGIVDDRPSIFQQIEGSILGEQPQPPSPGPATSLHTDSPAHMQVNPPSPPAPIVPVVNWDNYFNNLENALSALKIEHEHTLRYLGTMLTGLQTLLHDEHVLSLCINGGFTIADMLDALPRSANKATPTPIPGPGIGFTKPMPKLHAKRVRINLPSPPALPKPSAPAKADHAPVALDKRPPPLEAPAVSRSAPKRPSRQQGKFTSHGPSRKGLVITAPQAIGLLVVHFTPEIVNNLNNKLAKDLKIKDLLITTAFDQNGSVFLGTTRVPTTSETAFVLKHVRSRITVPEGKKPIVTTPQYSTSYLKIIDIPITNPKAKDWIKITTVLRP